MQFIPNGPDIPNALLHAHEEGRVVFFCGAGVSYPAGLPSFKTLVDEIYNGLHEQRNEGEEKTYQRGLYDLTLNLLEARLQGEREEIYEQIANILKPKRRKNATKTHESLLQLGRCREKKHLRLVTTNFDLCFDKARNKLKENFNTYTPTAIPIPKPDR
jgi:NAD-dependent SIR2 family protein deacetylase